MGIFKASLVIAVKTFEELTFLFHCPGIEVATQTLPIHPAILNNPARRTSTSQVELVFRASQIPPLGFLSFFITGTPTDKVNDPTPSDNAQYIGNDVSIIILTIYSLEN